MDISNKFSLMDFLAFLFPGIVSTLGLYLVLLLTPLNPLLISLPIDLATGILLLTSSYVLGGVLSGFSEIVVKFIAQRSPRVWVKQTIPVPGFKEEILSAFCATFGGTQEDATGWSATHFHLCRSMVFEFMPGLAQWIQRESSLRQLRMNLILAVAIWLMAGVGWGIRIINSNMPVWGYALIIGSVISWFPVIGAIVNRMRRNEERETREVLTAFLAGYKKGLFEEKEGSDSESWAADTV
jgi:hypothetical protein